jgi:CheY-like chemotaxis protein
MRPSVLIVDDHKDFRRSARAMLQAEGFVVVGEAGDGTEAIAKARDARPDLVLVDIQLPDLDGFVVADHLAAWPNLIGPIQASRACQETTSSSRQFPI